MEPHEVEFEKLVANLRIDDQPDPGHKDRLRWQVLQAYHAAANQPASRSGLSRIRRILMKSSFTKFALAASVIFAVALGLFFGIGGGSIALAQVAEKLEQISSFSYKIHTSMKGLPGMPAGQKMKMEGEILISSPVGLRMTTTTDGKLAMTGIMNFAENTMITLMPEMKQYMRVTLTDELLTQAKRSNGDPKFMVEEFLKSDYTDLGRSLIDGVEVQGFESDNPAVTGGSFKNSVARIWVDVNTGFPFRMTIDGEGLQEGSAINLLVDQFEWNVPCDPEMFSLVIPEGYTSMGDITLKGLANGEELIEAIKFFQELSGGRFPKSLNTLDLSQELVDLNKATAKAPTTLKECRKKSSNSPSPAPTTRCSDPRADPKYYGDTVQPGEADKVLVRWKTPEGQYRVIYGDLRSEEVTAERLAELEAQP